MASTLQAPAQPTGRQVDWLHGFNGNTAHWAGYAAALQTARQMVSFTPNFNTTGTINSITSEVRSQIPDGVTNNIGIGHSLGGVVCRNTEVEAENAPHDGFLLEAEMTTGTPGVPTYRNKEVNHMEVLNHPEMWNNFNSIFDSSTFFNTPTR